MSEHWRGIVVAVFLFGFGLGGNIMRWSMIKAGWKKPDPVMEER